MNVADRTALRLNCLGWDRPFAHAVAGALAEMAGNTLDFSGVSLLVPGGRAGRRIVALLADLARQRGVAMIPPAVRTPGNLPENLLETPGKAAGNLACGVAWARALMAMDPDLRQALFPQPPGRGDFPSWFRVAEILARCRQELTGGMLSFARVAELAEKNAALGNADRWRAAATVEAGYLAELADAGLVDPQRTRNDAIAAGRLRECRRLVFAGVVQINRQLREMLHAAAARGTRVDIFLYAPETHRDRFDDLGCVKPDAWTRALLPLERANIRTAQGPEDVACAVFRAMAQMPAPPRADEITIGLLDEALVPFVRAEAAALGDIPVRYGVGKPLPHTRPYQLLAAATAFLESRRFRDFQILVRHPDTLTWLSTQWKQSHDRPERDWLTLLDTYASCYFPDLLTPACAAAEGWRQSAEKRDYHVPPDLAWLYERVCRFADAGNDPETTDTLAAWSPRILAILHAAYAGRAWDSSKPEELVIVRACGQLREALDELRGHTAGEQVRITQAEAVRICLSLAAAGRAVPEFTGHEIDMVGWLELMPDDAASLIVAGFSDDIVPEAAKPDPFLNESVRKALGLPDDEERLARDAYLLAAILESRPPRNVTLISGRWNADGDPLHPSRLLFACDRAQIAERVKAFTGHNKETAAPLLAYRNTPGTVSGFGKMVIPPRDKIIVPDFIRVTAFRDYLASPQGYYLKHIHNGGLETLDGESPRELLVMDFGNLVHDIVREAMGCDVRGGSPAVWEARLIEVLHRRVNETFGDNLSASFRFQVALLEKRFARLARWQHDWWKQGWRIKENEWMPAQPAALTVDGQKMTLRGRIDRIDVHESTGEIAVLDYKVCSGNKDPEKTHVVRGQWIDLQLPLYSTLAAERIGGAKVRLGYIRIADDPIHINEALANWNAANIAEAHDVAHEVIRKIRAKEFDSPGDRPPNDGVFGYIFGEGLLKTADDEGGDDA